MLVDRLEQAEIETLQSAMALDERLPTLGVRSCENGSIGRTHAPRSSGTSRPGSAGSATIVLVDATIEVERDPDVGSRQVDGYEDVDRPGGHGSLC